MKRKGDEEEYEEERRMFSEAFEAFEKAVKDGLLDGLSNFMAIARALLTRWIYVNEAVEHLMRNWLMWYFSSRARRGPLIGRCELCLWSC